MAKNIIDRVLKLAGGQTQLALALGIRKQSITKWKAKGQIPVLRVPDVARVTGISEYEIRPDFFRKDHAA